MKQSKYAKTSGAETTQRMNFPRPVHGIFRIDSMREQKSRSGEGVTVELTTVRVLSTPPAVDYDRRAPYAPITQGEVMHDRMRESNVGFDRWLKSVVLAASDMTDAEFQEAESYPGEGIEEALSEEQPFAGTAVEIRAVQVVKEKSQGKAEEDLKGADVYIRTDYLRRVPFSELEAMLSDDEKAKFFPELEAQVAAEAE